jgi:hypothetical protein
MEAPNLANLYGQGSILGGMLGLEQHNMSMDQAQMQQAKGLQDMFQSFQKHPLDMEATSLGNQKTQAQIPGIQAEASLAQDKADVSRNTKGLQLDAATQELMSKIDTETFKTFQRTLETRAMKGDPAAREALKWTKDVIAERTKQDSMLNRQAELAKLKAERDMALEAYKSKAREALQKAKAAGGPGAVKTYQALAAQYMQQAGAEPDPEKQVALRQLAQEAVELAYAQAQAGPAATPRPVLTPEGAIGYSGGSPAAMPNVTQPPAQPAATSQYSVGKTYTGKTGTYRYKGGDPANKASWEKVQ